MDAIYEVHGLTKVLRQVAVDELREETGESVDAYFREVYKC